MCRGSRAYQRSGEYVTKYVSIVALGCKEDVVEVLPFIFFSIT